MLFNWLDRNLEKIEPAAARLAGQDLHGPLAARSTTSRRSCSSRTRCRRSCTGSSGRTCTTWVTGISLLVIVYYMGGAAFLVDPSVADISAGAAIAIGDRRAVRRLARLRRLWRRSAKNTRAAPSRSRSCCCSASVFGFAQVFSGRAAYIQTGVLIGTLMTGNVWIVIVPSQRELVAATPAGPDAGPGAVDRAKQRSIHNNYLTFPLLFIMSVEPLSRQRRPAASTGSILIVLMVGGAGVRHFMNIRYLGGWLRLAARHRAC